MTPAAVVACALTYLGTPFVHQGRSVAGLDCAGLLIRVARDLGIPAIDLPGYGRMPHGDALRAHLARQCHEAPIAGTLRPGQILLLRFGAEPQHVGIVGATGRTMIHALSSAGGVVEHRINAMWRARIVAVFEFPHVAY